MNVTYVFCRFADACWDRYEIRYQTPFLTKVIEHQNAVHEVLNLLKEEYETGNVRKQTIDWISESIDSCEEIMCQNIGHCLKYEKSMMTEKQCQWLLKIKKERLKYKSLYEIAQNNVKKEQKKYKLFHDEVLDIMKTIDDDVLKKKEEKTKDSTTVKLIRVQRNYQALLRFRRCINNELKILDLERAKHTTTNEGFKMCYKLWLNTKAANDQHKLWTQYKLGRRRR